MVVDDQLQIESGEDGRKKFMKNGWEVIIGMEIHAQLATETKIFCGCATSFGHEANSNTCPVCLGLPGALPVLNERVVELGAKAALSLGLTVNDTSIFSRKNWFSNRSSATSAVSSPTFANAAASRSGSWFGVDDGCGSCIRTH